VVVPATGDIGESLPAQPARTNEYPTMITITFHRTGPPRAIRIRIVRVPAGDAPEAARKAWVGGKLPLHLPGMYRPKVSGIRSPARGRFENWIRCRLGLIEGRVGYLVEAGPAVEELSRHNPPAARWYRVNIPQRLGPGEIFHFAAEECRTVETE